jgi:YVTN family beta-propeller protein
MSNVFFISVKTKSIIIFLFFVFTLALNSCKEKDLSQSLSIQINDLVIVNGGDNSLSIVDPITLLVKNIFFLENPGSSFAHHIYGNKIENLIGVALPEYDFSAGHSNLHGQNVKGYVLVFDATTGKKKHLIETSFANHNVVFNVEGTEAWTSLVSHSGKVLVYDVNSGKLLNEISVNSDPTEIIISKSGKYAFVACEESSFLTVIDTKSKKIVKEIKVDKFPTGVYYGFDDNSVFVENANNKSTNIIDIEKLEVIDFIDHNFICGMPVFNKKESELWVCHKNGNSVTIYKKNQGSWVITNQINTENDPHQIMFFENETKAMVINQKSNSAQIFDTNTKKLISKINTGSKPNGILQWK